MANNFAGNPWWVDTAGAGALAKTDHTPVWVAGLSFSGYTTGAADAATISFRGDAHTFILQGTANKDTINVIFGTPIQLKDIVVSGLTSGKVAIWLGARSG